jgi:hypothetical protein
MSKNNARDFVYSAGLEEAIGGGTIDKEAGIIKGVVILTGDKVSRNKTLYTKKALEEAVTRYEGAKMYLDHPKSDEGVVRSVRDLGGTYKNVRLEEGRMLKADLHLLPNDGIKNLVIPIAEAKPQGVGLSIRDRGKGRDENGVFLVESFAPKSVFSIDLVTEASVNENLFESIEGGDDMKIEEITLDDLQKGNPTLVEAIKKDERATVMKELEEKIKKGEQADALILEAKKAKILAEAGFTKEVMEKVGQLINSAGVTFELAESIVKTQKELIAAKPPAGAPKVKGHGGGGAENLSEAELPTDEQLAEAVENA